MTTAAPSLARVLSPVQVTAGGVGIIIGAGIYVLIGEATAEAGGAVWASFLLAAVLCGLTGLSYCELAAAYPTAAAEYEYSRRAFPEVVAFLVGWLMMTALVVAAATVSLGFGRYVGHFFDVEPRVAALGLLAALFLLSASGIRQAGAVMLLLSLIQVGGLALVIAIGLPSLGDHSLTQSTGPAGIVGGAALVFFAFIGFDEVITLGEETADPVRTVPRALLTALAISTVLYMLTAVAAVSAIGADALGSSERPLADVVAKVAGGASSDVVAAAALISTTNTTLLALTAGSRMLYAMAARGAVPRWLSSVTRRTKVPLASITVVTAIAALSVVAADLSILAQVTDLAIYVVFTSVNVAVIVLRYREPETPRPFRAPGAVGRLPILPVLALLAAIVMFSGVDLEAAVACAGISVVGLAAGLLLDVRSPLRRRLGGAGG